MKSIFVILSALALSCAHPLAPYPAAEPVVPVVIDSAPYPPAEPLVPVVVNSAPYPPADPVVPAAVYGVPEVPAVTIVQPEPVAPIVVVSEEASVVHAIEEEQNHKEEIVISSVPEPISFSYDYTIPEVPVHVPETPVAIPAVSEITISQINSEVPAAIHVPSVPVETAFVHSVPLPVVPQYPAAVHVPSVPLEPSFVHDVPLPVVPEYPAAVHVPSIPLEPSFIHNVPYPAVSEYPAEVHVPTVPVESPFIPHVPYSAVPQYPAPVPELSTSPIHPLAAFYNGAIGTYPFYNPISAYGYGLYNHYESPFYYPDGRFSYGYSAYSALHGVQPALLNGLPVIPATPEISTLFKPEEFITAYNYTIPYASVHLAQGSVAAAPAEIISEVPDVVVVHEDKEESSKPAVVSFGYDYQIPQLEANYHEIPTIQKLVVPHPTYGLPLNL